MSRLEKTTHAFLIVVSCAALATLGRQYWAQRAKMPDNGITMATTRALVRRVQVGAVFPLRDVDWHRASTNVVLDIRSGCTFCQSSLPFYRHLLQVTRNHPSALSVLAVSSDSVAVMRTYLGKAGLTVDRVIHADPESLGIPGTPTIVLVDSAGIVTRRFIGKLSASDERALLTLLDALPGSTRALDR
jgi:hypothetical protein